MPIRWKDCDKIAWLEADDLPLAPVVSIGAALYIAVCPLCGCMHELRGQSLEGGQQATITPRCLLREFAGQYRERNQDAAWVTIYRQWLKTHPGAADCEQVTAVMLGSVSKFNTVTRLNKALAAIAPHVEAKAA